MLDPASFPHVAAVGRAGRIGKVRCAHGQAGLEVILVDYVEHVAVGLVRHPGLGLPEQESPGLLVLLCAHLRGEKSTCSLAGVSGSPLVFLATWARCVHTHVHT